MTATRTFTTQEIEEAAEAAKAELRREVATAQARGFNMHPHETGQGDFYITSFFLAGLADHNREGDLSDWLNSDFRNARAWIDEYSRSPGNTPEGTRAILYAFHAGLGSLGLTMPERSGFNLKQEHHSLKS